MRNLKIAALSFLFATGTALSLAETTRTSTGTVKSASPYKNSAAKNKKRVPINPKQRLSLNKTLLLPPPPTNKYNEPADLINLVPILREINEMIPRQFALAEHQFTLDPNRLVVEHSFYDSSYSRMTQKTSIISFSYAGNLGRQFSTHLDVPLFYSSIFGFSDWSRYPLGNYTMTFSRDSFLPNETYYIRAITRF